MKDRWMWWYFLAVCGAVLGACFISAGLRSFHSRINVLFGIAWLCVAAAYACRGRREKRNKTTDTDETTVEQNGGNDNE